MKIAAFLKLRNELENGNLIRCLDNCKLWADEIFICDDYSTDGSQKVYLDYTDKGNIIFRKKCNFQHGVLDKQELMYLINKTYKPDWIGWQDGDAIFDRTLTYNLKKILEVLEIKGFDSLITHYINLWRSECYFRIDNAFNGLNIKCLWKNKDHNLKFNLIPGIHTNQTPLGLNKPFNLSNKVCNIHYGFSTKEKIIKKYLTYKSFGQKGWELTRLIDEQTSFQLVKLPKIIYPDNNIPENYDNEKMPSAISYKEYI